MQDMINLQESDNNSVNNAVDTYTCYIPYSDLAPQTSWPDKLWVRRMEGNTPRSSGMPLQYPHMFATC